jgi:hypothetical protein
MIYELGTNVDFEAVFTNFSTGILIDPNLVQSRVYHYVDNLLTGVETLATMVKASTGRYIRNIPLTTAKYSLSEVYFFEVSGYENLLENLPAVVNGTIAEDYQITTGVNNTFSFVMDGTTHNTPLTAGVGSAAVITGSETENFTFVDASSARDIGSVAGPYNIQANVNDELRIAVNGGIVQTVTLPTGPLVTLGEVINDINAQTTGLTASNNGGFLQLSSDTTGSTSTLFIGGGTVNTTLGLVSDSNFTGVNSNRELKISIDSDDEQAITFDVGVFSAAQVVSHINVSAVDFTASVFTSGSAAYVRLTNTTVNKGYRSTIDIGSGGANSELGLETGTTKGGVGRLGQDVCDEINATVGNGTPATMVSGKIRLTSPVLGAASRIQVLSGNANATLGFTSQATTIGQDVIREDFLNVEEFLIVEKLAPQLNGLNVSFSG